VSQRLAYGLNRDGTANVTEHLLDHEADARHSVFAAVSAPSGTSHCATISLTLRFVNKLK
jgi:hypothetical protein